MYALIYLPFTFCIASGAWECNLLHRRWKESCSCLIMYRKISKYSFKSLLSFHRRWKEDCLSFLSYHIDFFITHCLNLCQTEISLFCSQNSLLVLYYEFVISNLYNLFYFQFTATSTQKD